MFWAKMLDFLVNVSLTSLGIIFHLVAIMFVGVVCDTIHKRQFKKRIIR